MLVPCQMLSHHHFLIQSLQVAVATSGKLASAKRSREFKLGGFELMIGCKTYASYSPIGFFPYFSADIKPLKDLKQFVGIEPVCPVPFNFDPALVLGPCQNFCVRLYWDSPIKIRSIKRIGVILNGVLYRPLQ